MTTLVDSEGNLILQKEILTYAIDEGYETKDPERGSLHAAGIDVFVPKFNKIFINKFNELNLSLYPLDTLTENSEYISISPHGSVIIPTGIRFNIPEGTYLEVANRGSVASKTRLTFGAHIVDEDYQGIVFINLINSSVNTVIVSSGAKIAQLIHKEYIKSALSKVKPDFLYLEKTARGEGALGSSGHN